MFMILSVFVSVNGFAAGGLMSLKADNAIVDIFPRVEKYSYQCAEATTSKTGSTDWVTENDQYAGTGEDIFLDANNMISTELDAYGRTVTRLKKEKMDSDLIKKTVEFEFYPENNGEAQKSVWVSFIKLIDGVETILSQEVDGLPRQVTSSRYVVKLSDKVTAYTRVNNFPNSRNLTDKLFSQIVQTCVYTLE